MKNMLTVCCRPSIIRARDQAAFHAWISHLNLLITTALLSGEDRLCREILTSALSLTKISCSSEKMRPVSEIKDCFARQRYHLYWCLCRNGGQQKWCRVNIRCLFWWCTVFSPLCHSRISLFPLLWNFMGHLSGVAFLSRVCGLCNSEDAAFFREKLL